MMKTDYESALEAELEREKARVQTLLSICEKAIRAGEGLSAEVLVISDKVRELSDSSRPLTEFMTQITPILQQIRRSGFTDEVKNDLFVIATDFGG